MSMFCLLSRYWEGTAVCTMLEDIDFICEVLRILMEACTENGKNKIMHTDYKNKYYVCSVLYLLTDC